MKSVAAVTTPGPGRKPGHSRRNKSAAAGNMARITDRKRLVDLSKWVHYLHDERGWSFRRIAERTTRGKGSYGYWQSIHTRAHLDKRPRIRPCLYDWHDLRALYVAVSSLDTASDKILDALLQVVDLQAQLSAAVVRALEVAADVARVE